MIDLNGGLPNLSDPLAPVAVATDGPVGGGWTGVVPDPLIVGGG